MRPLARRIARAFALLALVAAGYGYAAWVPTCGWFGEVIVTAPAGSDPSPRVALTFDDGPDPEVTPRILDALAAEQVHATFFVVGERAAKNPELVARVAAEGHSLGNHSFDHPPLIALSGERIDQQLDDTAHAIRAAIGRDVKWFRPPFGLRDPRVLSRARERGMQTVLWSCSPRDWQEPSAEEIRSRVLAEVKDGSIVLLHDGDARAHCGRPHTAQALPELLRELKSRGFRILSLDELLESGRALPENGR